MIARAGLLGAAWLLAGCGDPLVGGHCMGGFVQRGSACVAIPGSPSTGVSGGAGGEGGGATSGSSTVSTGSTGGGGAGDCGALTSCFGACVDTSTDPLHCGDCDNECPTGLCVEGVCQGAVAGHVVALGFDYRNVSAGTSVARLLGNAAFLHPHAPLRVVDFRGFDDPSTSAHLEALLDAEGAARGRVVQMTHPATAGAVVQWLDTTKTDVFLLNVPSGGHPEAIAAVTQTWAPALDAFGKKGGVVVVLVGVDAPALMDAALHGTDLFPALTCGGSGAGPFAVDDFLDSLTAGLATPFAAPSAGFELALGAVPSPTLSLPVVDANGAPVAVHIVIPPAASSP